MQFVCACRMLRFFFTVSSAFAGSANMEFVRQKPGQYVDKYSLPPRCKQRWEQPCLCLYFKCYLPI